MVNTKIGTSFGLALLLAIGVLATMLAAGVFSSRAAVSTRSPESRERAAVVESKDGASITVTGESQSLQEIIRSFEVEGRTVNDYGKFFEVELPYPVASTSYLMSNINMHNRLNTAFDVGLLFSQPGSIAAVEYLGRGTSDVDLNDPALLSQPLTATFSDGALTSTFSHVTAYRLYPLVPLTLNGQMLSQVERIIQTTDRKLTQEDIYPLSK